MIEQEVKSICTDALTFLEGVEVRSLWEVGHAAVLTVLVLHAGTQIRLESLGLCASILSVGMLELWIWVGGQASGDDVFWVDGVDNRWLNVVLVVARVNVFWVFVVVMGIDVLWIILGIDVWLDVAWVVLCAWDTVGSPRMVEDPIVVSLRDAQVVVVANFVERILHWV